MTLKVAKRPAQWIVFDGNKAVFWSKYRYSANSWKRRHDNGNLFLYGYLPVRER